MNRSAPWRPARPAKSEVGVTYIQTAPVGLSPAAGQTGGRPERISQVSHRIRLSMQDVRRLQS